MDQVGLEYAKDKKDLISDFNEAKFQIYRLNLIWINCQTLSQNGEFTMWKWKLDAAWRELSSDAMEKDGYAGDYNGWMTKGKQKRGLYIHQVNELNENIAKSNGGDSIYKVLQEKEIFLRCLQDAVGKGSKKRSSDDDDIDG